ncbi:HAMP domain-containing histidine kinase, partial [bacterium]|nr:HAMP domain-containing histidine kinase [bacterium]
SEKDRKRIFDYLDLIQSESERCEAITKKLLDFSYSGGDEKNLYDVVAVCQEVTSMVSHLSKYKDKSVTVNRSLPLHAWVNGPEIKQVVLNIIANALDASESGGTVEVAVNELPDQVEISVTDHGSGMTKEQQAKIFEPFFTTKEVGQGTGLGLSITHRIMVDHDGTLEVHSDGEGQGSTFTLRFPKKKASLRAA